MADRTIQYRQLVEVAPRDCASQWGNDGLEILSTPSLLGTMERVCVEALTPVLGPGEMTVGTGVTMTHTAPARLGEQVSYEIEAVIDGRRIDVKFTVQRIGGVVVSSGEHRRAKVNVESFLRSIGTGV